MELWLDYSWKYNINNLNYIVLVKTAKISSVSCIIYKDVTIEEGWSGRNGIPWNSVILICNLKIKIKKVLPQRGTGPFLSMGPVPLGTRPMQGFTDKVYVFKRKKKKKRIHVNHSHPNHI